MPFRITHLPSSDKLCHRLSWPLMEQFYPRERIEALVESFCGEATRARKLTLVLVVWVLIGWNLYLRHSLGAVFLKLSSVERWLGEQEPEAPPTRAAWTYRRKQLGVRLLRTLFELCCVPLAEPETPGAFRLRPALDGLDGTLEDVNDTPENAAYFSRICDGKSRKSLHRKCAASTWSKLEPTPIFKVILAVLAQPPNSAWREAAVAAEPGHAGLGGSWLCFGCLVGSYSCPRRSCAGAFASGHLHAARTGPL